MINFLVIIVLVSVNEKYGQYNLMFLVDSGLRISIGDPVSTKYSAIPNLVGSMNLYLNKASAASCPGQALDHQH